jgi:UDP-N-acetyl-D-mannosaminuronate dehydrogenase
LSADESFDDWTMAVILTDHDDVDHTRIAEQVSIAFDTRGNYRKLGLRFDNVVSL